MSSDLPPDLLDPPNALVNKVGMALAFELGHTVLNIHDGIPGPNTARIAREALAALAEWADGALIDPETWTRWDREEVAMGVVDWDVHGTVIGVEVQITDPGEILDNEPLFTLTKREEN